MGTAGLSESTRVRLATQLEWVEFFLLHEAHHLYAVMQRVRGG